MNDTGKVRQGYSVYGHSILEYSSGYEELRNILFIRKLEIDTQLNEAIEAGLVEHKTLQEQLASMQLVNVIRGKGEEIRRTLLVLENHHRALCENISVQYVLLPFFSGRDVDVFAMRFALNPYNKIHTYRAIAENHGISAPRVRQVVEKCMRFMKRHDPYKHQELEDKLRNK